MKVTVKAAYFDQDLGRQLEPGEVVEMTKERVAVIDGAFPGFVEEVKAKRAAKKKEE